MPHDRRTAVARILLALSGLLVAAVTLAPVPWRTVTSETTFGVLGVRTWLDAATWSSGRPGEFLANILLFVPLGLLLRMSFPRARVLVVLLGAVAIAGAIEVAQLPLDRVSDPRDLVANTLGAVLGIVGGSLAGRARRSSPSRRRPRTAPR